MNFSATGVDGVFKFRVSSGKYASRKENMDLPPNAKFLDKLTMRAKRKQTSFSYCCLRKLSLSGLEN